MILVQAGNLDLGDGDAESVFGQWDGPYSQLVSSPDAIMLRCCCFCDQKIGRQSVDQWGEVCVYCL